MNKSELIKRVAEATDMRNPEATRAVEAVFDTIAKSLKAGEDVSVTGFGTFTAKTRAAREGRNPATKAAITIPARTSAAFKPAPAMKNLA